MEAKARVTARNVRLFFVYGFLMDFAIWAGVWIKYLMEDRGLELKWILAMDMPFWLLVAVLQAPTGALADHIGRRRVMALGGLLFSATVLGFGFTQNYWMLFADYMLWAVAMSMMSGADQALVYDSLKESGEEDRFQKIAGRGFAVRLIAGMAGITLGGILGGWLSLGTVTKLGAIPPLLAAIVALTLHEPVIEHEVKRYWASLSGAVRFAWHAPQVRYTLLIGSVLLAGTFGPVVLIQPFLIEHDVSNVLFGVYQAPLRLVSVIAALVAFRVSARMGVGPLLATAGAAIVICYGGLAGIQSTAAFGFFGLSSLMAGLTRPAVDGYLNQRIESSQRATVLSIMQLLFAFQVAFFEPALGFFADGISLKAAFLFAAAYFLVLMPPLLFLWGRANRLRAPAVATAAEAAAG
ncbi:MAG: MFS transporter [Chloroflexi bacterium]|nr:MFS transporter [Chloroflexota bacterium]